MSTVLFEQSGPIAQITLNKPEQHNALGAVELDLLQALFRQITQEQSARVLIVTGAGTNTFCAGASLRELGSGQISGDRFQATTDQLAALPIPTICALNGNVFGGGVELALSCDFRLGVTGSRMRVPAARIGLCYPTSGIERFVRRLGVSAAKRILMAAEEFSADQLLDIGFLDAAVQPEDLHQRCRDKAIELASLAPLAVSAMKQLIAQAASSEGVDRAMAEQLSRQCAESSDLQEGFAAQREKRAANFKGH